mmetsp:Transcript_24527/g.56528  ORF Transcript_24527/g.56528 Transcript_24527/m.56528 type:complete len:490 (+) Transcript_24527:86-1555(+)
MMSPTQLAALSAGCFYAALLPSIAQCCVPFYLLEAFKHSEGTFALSITAGIVAEGRSQICNIGFMMLYDMSKREGWETSVGFPFLGAVLVGLVIVALANPAHMFDGFTPAAILSLWVISGLFAFPQRFLQQFVVHRHQDLDHVVAAVGMGTVCGPLCVCLTALVARPLEAHLLLIAGPLGVVLAACTALASLLCSSFPGLLRRHAPDSADDVDVPMHVMSASCHVVPSISFLPAVAASTWRVEIEVHTFAMLLCAAWSISLMVVEYYHCFGAGLLLKPLNSRCQLTAMDCASITLSCLFMGAYTQLADTVLVAPCLVLLVPVVLSSVSLSRTRLRMSMFCLTDAQKWAQATMADSLPGRAACSFSLSLLPYIAFAVVPAVAWLLPLAAICLLKCLDWRVPYAAQARQVRQDVVVASATNVVISDGVGETPLLPCQSEGERESNAAEPRLVEPDGVRPRDIPRWQQFLSILEAALCDDVVVRFLLTAILS